MSDERVCACGCGTSLVGRHWRAEFASPAHRRAHDRARDRAKRQAYRVTCPVCKRERTVRGDKYKRDTVARCKQCQKTRATPPQLLDKQWLERAYADYSAERIALALGTSSRAVRYWLGRHEIRQRTQLEAVQHYFAQQPGRVTLGPNRQMVTGMGFADSIPGSVKHFGT